MRRIFVTSKLSENISETPEGYLLCLNVPIARTGEMVYGHGESPIQVGTDGKAIVTREAKELFRPETIASFEGKPFTIKHPEDFVNPDNWKMLSTGVLQNVRRGTGETENDLLADILVTDRIAIREIKSGLREVSCGYECEYIELGVGRGMQTNIIGNHLALVEAGRAGGSYAINDQQGAKMSKLKEKVKSIFAKAGDEAAKVVDESSKEDTTSTDDGDKAPAWATKLEKTMARVADALQTASASSGQPSVMDEEKKDDDKKKDDKSEDADKEDGDDKDKSEDEGSDVESRMSALEAKVDKLLSMMGEEGEDEEMAMDADEEEEESEDDDFEESPKAKDNAMDEKSRIEILAPGFKAKGKDAKRAALIECAKTKDNAMILKRLNGGKDVDLKKASAKTIDHLFIGASEVVGLYRTKTFTKLKQARDSQTGGDTGSNTSEAMTPEKLNEINKKHYAQGSH